MDTLHKGIVLVGYSGHSFVVADILTQLGYRIEGYLDKEPAQNNPFSIPYLGFEGNETVIEKIRGLLVFPSIGDNGVRRKVFEQLISLGFSMPNAISPRANVSIYSNVEEGALICQGVCINAFAKIGRGAIVNTGAIVEHECNIGSFAHIAPGAVLAGNVNVGEGSFVGANSAIKQGVEIGRNVIIGAGSVVINNIADSGTYAGNPARKIK